MARPAMHSNEWPLVGFTLAAQTAVGMVVGFTGIYDPLADRVGVGPAEDLAAVVLVFVLALLALAGAAATLHLGNVRNVYLVLANWRSSWLSREVLLVSVFTSAVAGYALMHLVGIGGTTARVVAGVVAGVIGLALVAAIAKLYMLRTVPVWDRPTTPLTFYATTLLLGFIGVAFAIAFLDGTAGLVQLLGVLALVVLAAQLAILGSHRSSLSREGGAATVSGGQIDETLAWQATWRITLAIGGAVILIPTALGWLPPLVGITMASLFVLASEILGRYLFYESYIRSGV